MKRRDFIAAALAASTAKGQPGYVSIEIPPNFLYYTLDCGLRPAQWMLDAVNSGKVQSSYGRQWREHSDVMKPESLIHQGPPRMSTGTTFKIGGNVLSGTPIPTDDDIKPNESRHALVFSGDIDRSALQAQRKLFESGKYPKWKSTGEMVQFIGNLTEKFPMLLIETSAGVPVYNKIAEEMPKEVAEGDSRTYEKYMRDKFIAESPAVRSKFMQEVKQIAAETKAFPQSPVPGGRGPGG